MLRRQQLHIESVNRVSPAGDYTVCGVLNTWINEFNEIQAPQAIAGFFVEYKSHAEVQRMDCRNKVVAWN